MDYITEVFVKKLKINDWLTGFCYPERFIDSCKACPNYGNVWSCPPNTPPVKGYLDRYADVFVIGIKVIYSKDVRLAADTPIKEEIVRRETYNKVKRALLEVLLCLEKEYSDSNILAAGRCELCEQCSRVNGNPCRKPDKMRYSFSVFGFDFTKLAKELFDLELLWSADGLPEYNVAIAAYLANKTCTSFT